MLFVYGALMPVRVMELIRHWKLQEKEHAAFIMQASPELEPQYVQLIQSWEPVFSQTAHYTNQRLDEWLPYPTRLPAYVEQTIESLIDAALEQSRTYIDQLSQLMERTAAVSTPLSRTVMLHAIRESNYYVGLMSAYRQGANRSSSREQSAPLQRVPVGGHQLPPLPYAYDALEPYIDEQTMRIHHDIHHQAYVDGLNKAELQLQAARESNRFELVKHWERELAFNGAGHYLHTLFWSIMSPYGGGEPVGALSQQLRTDFGSPAAFQRQFSEAAIKVEGGGWALLVWSPRSRRLEILMAEKHQNLSQWDVVPILALDVWEHAYYLKHQNNRADYVQSWWNVVIWPFVNERFEEARKLTWAPY
ncbi:Fe-Mn family superoxide dismutase [Paenibacillus endophyticus]|uniref:superoxide dismutase n=1 Tax=Paenibacillus endophyticus TaxID=1294268 RepID=A0A7W5CF00_9BACL|nr:Fe-Mn family superoxide dismutase [Paenibacillus endophyticus]MBB3155674.1 Fe-Mn family superoxide dismutase [Paenibacillus endophyticus]